jgi:hypothetical protein
MRFGGTKAPGHQARCANPVALRVGDVGRAARETRLQSLRIESVWVWR